MRFETTVSGRWWASSVAASKLPLATSRSTSCSASAVIWSCSARSESGRSGRITTRRWASCCSPSLHSVLPPRNTLFISSFIITPYAEENVCQSSRTRRTEEWRVMANISYLLSHTVGPASRNWR